MNTQCTQIFGSGARCDQPAEPNRHLCRQCRHNAEARAQPQPNNTGPKLCGNCGKEIPRRKRKRRGRGSSGSRGRLCPDCRALEAAGPEMKVALEADPVIRPLHCPECRANISYTIDRSDMATATVTVVENRDLAAKANHAPHCENAAL